MIRDGWARCGLARVLDSAQQVDAMRFCMQEPVQALGVEEQAEDADSDGEEEEDGKEEAEAD